MAASGISASSPTFNKEELITLLNALPDSSDTHEYVAPLEENLPRALRNTTDLIDFLRRIPEKYAEDCLIALGADHLYGITQTKEELIDCITQIPLSYRSRFLVILMENTDRIDRLIPDDASLKAILQRLSPKDQHPFLNKLTQQYHDKTSEYVTLLKILTYTKEYFKGESTPIANQINPLLDKVDLFSVSTATLYSYFTKIFLAFETELKTISAYRNLMQYVARKVKRLHELPQEEALAQRVGRECKTPSAANTGTESAMVTAVTPTTATATSAAIVATAEMAATDAPVATATTAATVTATTTATATTAASASTVVGLSIFRGTLPLVDNSSDIGYSTEAISQPSSAFLS